MERVRLNPKMKPILIKRSDAARLLAGVQAMERGQRVEIKGRRLISRRDAARQLGCSWITLYRLDRLGLLTVVRLSSSSLGKVFYPIEEIEALAHNEKAGGIGRSDGGMTLQKEMRSPSVLLNGEGPHSMQPGVKQVRNGHDCTDQ